MKPNEVNMERPFLPDNIYRKNRQDTNPLHILDKATQRVAFGYRDLKARIFHA